MIKKTALDKIFNSVEEKNKFIKILINLSHILNNDKLEMNNKGNLITHFINKFKNKSIQYSNLSTNSE